MIKPKHMKIKKNQKVNIQEKSIKIDIVNSATKTTQTVDVKFKQVFFDGNYQKLFSSNLIIFNQGKKLGHHNSIYELSTDKPLIVKNQIFYDVLETN